MSHNVKRLCAVVAIGLLLLIKAQKSNRITKAEYQHISHHSTKPMLVAGFFLGCEIVKQFKFIKMNKEKLKHLPINLFFWAGSFAGGFTLLSFHTTNIMALMISGMFYCQLVIMGVNEDYFEEQIKQLKNK